MFTIEGCQKMVGLIATTQGSSQMALGESIFQINGINGIFIVGRQLKLLSIPLNSKAMTICQTSACTWN